MVDPMRGRSTAWYRIRVNLRNVPEDERPPQEALEVDYDPWEGMDVEAWRREERERRKERPEREAPGAVGHLGCVDVTYALLLDVSSLMYRAFFAMRDTVMRRPTAGRSAPSTGTSTWSRVCVVTRRPDEVVHVYDHEWRPVARTDIYAGYKANRPEDPRDLPEQFALLRQVLDLTGMPQARRAGGRPRTRSARSAWPRTRPTASRS